MTDLSFHTSKANELTVLVLPVTMPTVDFNMLGFDYNYVFCHHRCD